MADKGQLKDVLNTKNLQERGFSLDENQIFHKDNLKQEENVKLSYQSGDLRLFLYPKGSDFAYSIGVDNNENDLIIRKINLESGEEMKLEKGDKDKIMDLALNSKQLQELGLDRGLENENERGFFQKALDFAAQKISENPITTKLLLGFLASAVAAPLTGFGAIAVGALAGFGAEGAVEVARKRNEGTLQRRNSSIGRQFEEEMEGQEHPHTQALNSSRGNARSAEPTIVHSNHVENALKTHPEIAARHDSSHLAAQIEARKSAAENNSSRG